MWSFGVTMRQCQTGKEPYEGLRAVEMMYHVRKGNYWEFQARQVMGHGALSPVDLQSEGMRRAESLRQPMRKRLHRPSLARTPSSDIPLRRTDEAVPEPPAAAEEGLVVKEGRADETQAFEQAREGWLKRMVDPDPAKRPTPEELLALVDACVG